MSEQVNILLGIVFILIGLAFIFLGFAGALLTLVKDARRPRHGAAPGGGLADITKLLEAVTKLFEAMAKGPLWLAATFVGLVLIGYGTYLALATPI